MDDQSVLNEIETWPIAELKDLRKTCATYDDEHVPESSAEVLSRFTSRSRELPASLRVWGIGARRRRRCPNSVLALVTPVLIERVQVD
jgi:hypothetical protein